MVVAFLYISVLRVQIKSLSEKIREAGFKIEKIYTSPLDRALESSQIISEVFNLSSQDIVIDDNLADVDIPAIAGKPLSIRDEIHNTGIDEYSGEYVDLGNEPRDEIVERMKKGFSRVVSESAGKQVAFVSHGDPIQFLLFTLRKPDEAVPSMNLLVDTDYPPKGSAVRITVDDSGEIIGEEKIR